MMVATVLAYVLMLLGLIGTIVPLIPGPPLVWLGIAIWAWADGFQQIGWVTLIILAAIALVAMASDLVVTAITGRKAGLRWRTIASAFAGACIGGVMFSALPVLGTLVGAILGALAGVMLSEYAQQHDWALAWQAARVYLVSVILSRLFELTLCLLMIGIFIWQAYF